MVALMGVPADATCVQIQAVGNRTVVASFDVEAGASAVLDLGSLPLGQVTFQARAFAGTCPPAADAVATWVSDAPFVTTVAVSPPALVTLNLVRNGNVSVVVGFDDNPDGGTTVPPGVPTPQVSTFMRVEGIRGGATAEMFEGFFELESFAVAATTPRPSFGGGGGPDKTTFTISARLKYQRGAPQLYGAATEGRVLPTVDVITTALGQNASEVWRARLRNAVVTSIASDESPTLPTLTLTFETARLDLEFISAEGKPTVVSFDLQRNTSSPLPRPSPSKQWVLGGPATPPALPIDAFRAPSETTVGGGTGGGGNPRPVFSDASVSLPLDANVLGYLVEQFRGFISPTAQVQLKGVNEQGLPAVLGSYGFENVAFTGFFLEGFDAKVTFAAESFSWTFGTEVVMTAQVR